MGRGKEQQEGKAKPLGWPTAEAVTSSRSRRDDRWEKVPELEKAGAIEETNQLE